MMKRRGYTLIELVVATAIGAALMLVAGLVVVTTSRALTRTQAHAQAQTAGQLGVGRFTNDVDASAASSFTLATALIGPLGHTVPIAISMCPQDNADITPFYFPSANYVLYYYDSTAQQWVRNSWTSTLVTGGVALTNAQLLTALTAPTSTRVLTNFVSAVTIVPDTLGHVKLTLTLTYDYVNGAQKTGLQSLRGSFTETFQCVASPENGP